MFLPSADHWKAVGGLTVVAALLVMALIYTTETQHWPAVVVGGLGEAAGGLIGVMVVAGIGRLFGPRGAVVGMAIGWVAFFFGTLTGYGVLG